MITAANAATAYSNARSAVAPSGAAETTLGRAAQDFEAALAATDTVAQQAMTGQAPTHQLVQTLAETQLAVETVVAIRDKVVEAYQEILRMPV